MDSAINLALARSTLKSFLTFRMVVWKLPLVKALKTSQVVAGVLEPTFWAQLGLVSIDYQPSDWKAKNEKVATPHR